MARTRDSRPDRCPGVLRPWPADDGALVRLRLIGGRLPTAVAGSRSARSPTTYGDGDVHLTGRANLQLRGLPLVGRRAARTEVVDGDRGDRPAAVARPTSWSAT